MTRFIVRAVITRALHRQVVVAAKVKGWSVSAWIRRLIERELSQQAEEK